VASQRQAASIENVRKLLLAMSRDLRVIMIKLADRRHNLLTLNYLPLEDQKRIATESLDIFAPLADRLGMGELKAEIEDTAFRYANPRAYELVNRLVNEGSTESMRYLAKLKKVVAGLLQTHGITAISIDARQKHLYSVFRKLNKADGDISKIYDLTALRIIVPEVTDCYQTLGVLHQQFKPLIYRIKDYIAVPKPNGYRSLHTTVLAPEGKITEFQIRTPAMHQEAEFGLAAHAFYNEHKDSKSYAKGEAAPLPSKLAWVGELAAFSHDAQNTSDLIEDLKIDLFQDRIFVFSPKGDLYDLPEGATPVDFAFAIHTDIGLRTQGAKVNGRIAPLDRALENRDVVDIITRKQAAPNRHWLAFVKTAGARNRIKAWFRAASRDTNIANGKQLLESKLKTFGINRWEDLRPQDVASAIDAMNLKDGESLLAALGEGTISLSPVLRKLVPQTLPKKVKSLKADAGKHLTGRMIVTGAPDVTCSAALCCNPQPPADLTGYITRGSGITVHRADCGNIPDEHDRLLECEWEHTQDSPNHQKTTLKIEAQNRIGLMRDVSNVLAQEGINIVKLTSRDTEDVGGTAHIEIILQMGDPFEMSGLIQRIESLSGVMNVEAVSRAATR
jgi:GTP pyrophosphokinase